MSLSIPVENKDTRGIHIRRVVIAADDWGWLLPLSAVVTLGLFVVVLSYNASRLELPYAYPLYWMGLLIQFIPIAIRLLGKPVNRKETIGLVVFLGFSLYLTKLLAHPLGLTFSDEFQQWRSAYDSLATNALFTPNPILNVSPYYPGLQNVTHAVVSITGLSIFDAAVMIIGATRLMFMLSLFLFFEQVSRSHRFAGLATLLYMCNPAFLGWTSYYVYQSLALPLSVLGLYCIVRLSNATNGTRFGLVFSTLIIIPAVIMTHHVTAFAFVGLLLLFAIVPPIWSRMNTHRVWYAATRATRRVSRRLSRWFAGLWFLARKNRSDHFENNGLGWLTLLTLIGIFIWITYVASSTLTYLGSQVFEIAAQVVGILTGQLSRASVYVAPDRPMIELYAGVGSLILLVIAVPFGMVQTVRRYRADSIAISMVVGSMGLFGALSIRFLSSRGGELLGRAWPYLYLLLAFVLAVGLFDLFDLKRWWRWPVRIGLIGFLVVLFTGGVANGWPPYWSRLPGQYLVGADERSVDDRNIAAADWARQNIQENSVMATDFVLHHILGAYGLQAPVLGMQSLFLDEGFGDYHLNLVNEYGIEYLVVDARMSESLPLSGFYYGSWENTHPRTAPANIRNLLKYDAMDNVSRIYDNGSIVFYDVRELLR